MVVIDPEALDERVDEVTEAPMPGMPELRRLVNRSDGVVRAVLVNGNVAWDADGRAPELGSSPSFGQVLRGTRVRTTAAIGPASGTRGGAANGLIAVPEGDSGERAGIVGEC